MQKQDYWIRSGFETLVSERLEKIKKQRIQIIKYFNFIIYTHISTTASYSYMCMYAVIRMYL